MGGLQGIGKGPVAAAGQVEGRRHARQRRCDQGRLAHHDQIAGIQDLHVVHIDAGCGQERGFETRLVGHETGGGVQKFADFGGHLFDRRCVGHICVGNAGE